MFIMPLVAFTEKDNKMAFGTPRFFVTFDLIGSYDGERSKTVEFLPAGADVAAKRAQLDTDITTFLTAWNNVNALTGQFVSSSFVPSYTISEKYVEGTAVPSFTGQENVYLEAQVQAELDAKGVKYSTYIQSPDAQIFVGNSVNTNKIDSGDLAYLAYAGLFEAGDICAISDGDQFVAPVNVSASALRSVRSGKAF